MPRWASNTWLSAPPLFTGGSGGVLGPSFALISPSNGAASVDAETPLRLAVYTTDTPVSVIVSVNGVTAYFAGVFSAGWKGIDRDFAGRKFLEIVPTAGFAEKTLYRVTAAATDASSNVTQASWTFTRDAAVATYGGTNLLTEEAWLLSPMEIFLNLEPLRQMLLQQVLRDEASSITNRNAIAARAIYQLAFETEISALLNGWVARNAAATKVRIVQRRPALALAQRVDAFRGSIDQGMASLFASGLLPREYRNNLADHLDSLLYSYRVSAAATLLFLARAAEVAAVEAPPVVNPTLYDGGLGSELPLGIGGE